MFIQNCYSWSLSVPIKIIKDINNDFIQEASLFDSPSESKSRLGLYLQH